MSASRTSSSITFDHDPRENRDTADHRRRVRGRLSRPVRRQSLARAAGDRQLAPDRAKGRRSPFPQTLRGRRRRRPCPSLTGTSPCGPTPDDVAGLRSRRAARLDRRSPVPAIIEERETTIVLPPGWTRDGRTTSAASSRRWRREHGRHRTRDPLVQPDRHRQRTGQGPAAHRLLPDRARGRRSRQRPVRRARADGRPGQHRHARATSTRWPRPGEALAARFHNQLSPGDIIITNDPWMSAGHFFDITVLCPDLPGRRLIGFIGSTIHHTDIGGYGIGAGARDIHEEGLWIPPSKLYEAGEPNALLHDIIRHNVRTPGPRVRRPGGAGLQRPGRRRAADRPLQALRPATTSRPSPTRSSPAPRRRPAGRSAPCRPAPGTARAASTCPAATSSR